jgi:hypothetical protein
MRSVLAALVIGFAVGCAWYALETVQPAQISQTDAP